MIAQFPSFYPDELLYSLLARYYAKSGYLHYRFAAEELFQSKTDRPDILFWNQYTPDVLALLQLDKTVEAVVTGHTMFPYYGRFLPAERRQAILRSLADGKGNRLLPGIVPKRKPGEKRYLRYCPECAKEDRENRGETYWHRIHQIPDICLCPVHKGYLKNTGIVICGNTSSGFKTAEEMIPKNEVTVFCNNEIEIKVADYIVQVLEADLDVTSTVEAGEFLHSKMVAASYCSARGEQRHMALFQKEFTQYYQDLPDNQFTEIWQMQKVLNGYRHHPYEICLMALFLDIPAKELARMTLPEKPREQVFDETIFRLRKQRVSYPEIARRLNAPYDTVKTRGRQKYQMPRKRAEKGRKGGTKPFDWESIDKETLSLVKETISQLQGKGEIRPRRVTIYAVEKRLGLPDKRITQYLPLCRTEVEKHQESQEEYWARETAWAVRKIQREGKPLNWKRIRSLTNMKRENFNACLSYLENFMEPDLYERMKDL